jgi:hypothetical protein
MFPWIGKGDKMSSDNPMIAYFVKEGAIFLSPFLPPFPSANYCEEQVYPEKEVVMHK